MKRILEYIVFGPILLVMVSIVLIPALTVATIVCSTPTLLVAAGLFKLLSLSWDSYYIVMIGIIIFHFLAICAYAFSQSSKKE